MLTIVDDLTRECLAIDVERRLGAEDVLERLTKLVTRQSDLDHRGSREKRHVCHHVSRDPMAKGAGVSTFAQGRW